MRALADENFPGPSLRVLRTLGWDILSIAEHCPGISDEEVVDLCVAEQRVLLTFDKDFGELAFRRGIPADCGIILIRVRLGSPADAAQILQHLVESNLDIRGQFCVLTKDRVRLRPVR